jgi:PIN domain nuclease of toxin-antitoxin system
MGGSARLKLLLDTHIWLWLFREPKRLGQRTFQELQDTKNELWLSPISTWEALTLHYKGRITLHSEPAKWVARATAGVREAVLTHEIMVVARQLSLHQDPADRMIAATALVLDLTLVTADSLLLGLANIKTLANR